MRSTVVNDRPTRDIGHRDAQPVASSRRRDLRELQLPPRERRGGRRQRVLAAASASA
jgi:hypothetical protein